MDYNTTDWLTIRDQFNNVGKSWTDRRFSSGLVSHSTGLRSQVDNGNSLYVGITVAELNNIIQWVSLESGSYSGGEYLFNELWRHQAPQDILDVKDLPTHIWISFAPIVEDGATPYYDLWVIYDQYGFYIHYHGIAEQENTQLRYCTGNPSLYTVDIYTTRMNHDVLLSTMLTEDHEEYQIPVPLELDTKQFVDTLDQYSNVCVVSPIDGNVPVIEIMSD